MNDDKAVIAALLSALKDFYDWCGKDYPGWPLVEAVISDTERRSSMEARTQGYGTIGWAVSALKHGHKVRRAEWGTKQWLIYAPPGSIQLAQKFGGGYNTTASIFIKTIDDTLVPWQCPMNALLADDWEMVDVVQPGTYHDNERVDITPTEQRAP